MILLLRIAGPSGCCGEEGTGHHGKEESGHPSNNKRSSLMAHPFFIADIPIFMQIVTAKCAPLGKRFLEEVILETANIENYFADGLL